MDLRELRAQGMSLDPVLNIGKGGLSPGALAQLDKELRAKRLVKVRFLPAALPDDAGKPERKAAAAELAARTGSKVVDVVGSVVVLYR